MELSVWLIITSEKNISSIVAVPPGVGTQYYMYLVACPATLAPNIPLIKLPSSYYQASKVHCISRKSDSTAEKLHSAALNSIPLMLGYSRRPAFTCCPPGRVQTPAPSSPAQWGLWLWRARWPCWGSSPAASLPANRSGSCRYPRSRSTCRGVGGAQESRSQGAVCALSSRCVGLRQWSARKTLTWRRCFRPLHLYS